MKIAISIPLILLMLFTGIRIDIGTHYCGGSVAATKVSLKRELASCGMESPTEDISHNQIITHNCCDDVVTGFTICNNYFPSTFSAEILYQTDFNLYISSSKVPSIPEITLQNEFTSIRPPGYFSSCSVVLSDICIFRI